MIRETLLLLYQGLLRVLQPQPWYYGSYYATDTRWLRWLKAVLRPQRLWIRVRSRQIGRLPYFLTTVQPARANRKSDGVGDVVSGLRRDGVVSLWTPEWALWARQIRDQYAAQLAGKGSSDALQHNDYQQVYDPRTFEFFTHEFFLAVWAQYFDCQPYLRAGLIVNRTDPMTPISPTRLLLKIPNTLAYRWHWDYPNLVQTALLLNDLTEADTHMQFVRGVHRRHRMNLGPDDAFYSDETIARIGEVVPLIGMAGTLWFFDSNSPHRLWGVPGRPRLWAKLEYTTGNAIVPLKHPELGFRVTVTGGIPWHTLSPLQQEAVLPLT